MDQEDQATQDEKRARRKRKIETVGYVIATAMAGVYCALFIRVALIGYLSRIAITAGIVFFASGFTWLAIGLTGKRALAKLLGGIWWGCAGIAMVVVLGGFVFWPQGPGPWRRYRFHAELAALEAERAVSDEDNAALRYDKILATVNPNDRPEFVFGGPNLRDKLTRRPWRREDYPQASDWLDSYAAVVAELLQIGQMEKCRWPIYAKYDCKWPVPYRNLSHAADLLTLTGNRHLGEGRLEEALTAYFSLLRQTDHMQQQTFILDFQCSYGAEEAALRMIRHILVHGDLSPEQVNYIAQRLPDAANNWQRDGQRLMDFEEYRFVNFLSRAYEINEQGKIRFTRSLPIRVEEEEDDADSTWLERFCPLGYLMTIPLDPQDLWPLAREEFTEMRRFLETGPLLPKDSYALGPPGMFSTAVIRGCCNPLRSRARDLALDKNAYARWGERYAENLARRRGTWLVLGMRRYRDQHGTWPMSLDQIAEQIPTDALLDPTRQERFVYRLREDGFTLYGTGINGIDEHGHWDGVKALDGHDDDIIIWPILIPEPPEPLSQEEEDEMFKQLAEIYGDRFQTGRRGDANDR